MKKLSNLLFLAILLAAFSFNAVQAQKNFYVGVRAQPQLSFMFSANDTAANRDLTFGYFGGLAIGQYFSKHFAFEASFLYSAQGQNFTSQDTFVTALGQTNYLSYTRERRELNYFKIPFVMRYVTSQTKRVAFTGYLGFQISYLFSARYYAGNLLNTGAERPTFLTENDYNAGFVEMPDSVPSGAGYLPYRSTYNPMLVGLVGGAGVDVRLGSNIVVHANVRADYDVIDSEDKTLKARDLKSRNNMTVGLQLGVSYVFGKREAPKPKTADAAVQDLPAGGETAPPAEEPKAEEPKPKKKKKTKEN